MGTGTEFGEVQMNVRPTVSLPLAAAILIASIALPAGSSPTPGEVLWSYDTGG